MKTRILSIAFWALAVASCQQNMEEPAQQIDNTFKLFAVQDNGADSKTVISGEKSVYWDPAEEIKVFKSDGSGFLFKSSNTEPVASAVFSGVLSKDDVEEGEELWAVYPFAEEASFDGETITTILPSEQVARAESFGRNMNLSIAKTTSTQLQFYNVGGGIRFTITQEGVNKVIFEGLNGEIISGKVTVGFEEGVPVVKEVTGGSQFITLLPPEGETFQKDKWYYIVAIPGALSGGYKLRFYKAEDYAKKVSETPVTIKRGIFGSVDKADEATEYESVVTSFPETEEEWDESENITMSIATASKLIIDVSKELSDNNSPNPIFVATELTKIDGVFKAEPNLEENSVTIVQDNGVYITLFLDLGAIGDEVETKSTNNSSSLTLRTNANSPILPTSKKAILLSPYQNSHYENGKQKGMNKVDIDKVREYLSSTGYTLAPYIDSEVSIEQMTGDNLLQYGVIIYIGHGGFRQPTTDGSSLTTILATGQEIGTISKEFENKYRDKLALAIYDGNPRYYITIPWLEATTNACYSNSIVYIGACNSYRDDDLFNYFWDNGARSYLGFGYYTFYHLENEDQNQAKAVLYSFLEGLSFGASSKNSFTLAPTIIQNEYPYFAAIYNSFSAAKWSGNNVYLTYPKPNNLKNTIKDNTVTFSWNNPPSSGQYKYYVYLNGIAYESQTERGLTLNDLTPGPYNWYVQADLYYRGKLIESFTSDTEYFTIDLPKKDKPVKSMSLTTDSPNAYFNSVKASFVYDSQGRLVGFSGSDGNSTVVYNYTYSGNSMTYSDNGSAKLNSQGQFSTYTWYGNTYRFNYDSSNRLSSLSLGSESINYKWRGNDIYSILYSDPSYYESGLPSNLHFEPSPYNAPTTGVDINLVMRIFMAEMGLDSLFPDGNFLAMMPGIIGKRSEHVLGVQFDTYEQSVNEYGISAFSQYKGKDGSWHAITPDVLYNWREGYGSFEVKGTKFPCKQESKPWVWTADNDGAVIRAKWPLFFSYGNVSGTLVVSAGDWDRDGDGIISEHDATFSIKNGRVTSVTSTESFSYNFTFGY